MSELSKGYIIRPDLLDQRLTERVAGVDQTGAAIETRVTVERALTIFLNAQEIVTAMTINDYRNISRSAICSTSTCSAR